jgi:hypothetical protein
MIAPNNNNPLVPSNSQPGTPARAASQHRAVNPYADVLVGSLREIVEQQVICAPAEQCMLYAELALCRESAKEAVKCFQIAKLGQNAGAQVEPGTVVQLGAIMVAALEKVAVMADRAAALEERAADKFSVHNLHIALEQVVQLCGGVLDKYLEPDTARLAAIELRDAVQDIVKLRAKQQAEGTKLLPDQTVLDMDATIPFPT